MQCQQCGQNEATVNMTVQINQKRMNIRLCQDCFNNFQNGALSFGTIPFSGDASALFNQFAQGGGSQNSSGTQTKQYTQQKSGLLDDLGTNVTDQAREGKIDPVIGRDKEIKRTIETLNRRNKNNPVLIGEPGVGKTAIAEGLALKIVEGDVPAKLLNKEVYLLDVASLVANTGIRGQFEERMKQLIQELKERPEVILFIDEIHLIVGAGTAECSQMDAGNILKPALARGELQVIGATTLKEYREIEKDAALERRFQPIIVNEPSIEESITILHRSEERRVGKEGRTQRAEVHG